MPCHRHRKKRDGRRNHVLVNGTDYGGGVVNVSHCSGDVMASTPTPPTAPLPPSLPHPHHLHFAASFLLFVSIFVPLTVSPSSRCSHILVRIGIKAAVLASRVFMTPVSLLSRVSPFVCQETWRKRFRKLRSNLPLVSVRPSAGLAQPVNELWGLWCTLSPADARHFRRSEERFGISVNDGTMSDQSERNEEMMDPREAVELCRIQTGSQSKARVWPQD